MSVRINSLTAVSSALLNGAENIPVSQSGTTGRIDLLVVDRLVSREVMYKPNVSSFGILAPGVGSIYNCHAGVRLWMNGVTPNNNYLMYAANSVNVGAGGWEAIARIRRHTPLVAWAMAGICLISSGTLLETMALGNDLITGFHRNHYSNNSTWTGVFSIFTFTDQEFWLKVSEISGTRQWSISRDGDFFSPLFATTVSNSAYVTSVYKVGVFWNANVASIPQVYNKATAIDILSWQQNALA